MNIIENERRELQLGFPRGPESLKLSNSMTWSDQNCPAKRRIFCNNFLLGQCVIFCNIFLNYFFKKYNTVHITDNEELLYSLDHWTVRHTLSNQRTVGPKLSNHRTVGHTLSDHRTVEYTLSNHRTVGHPLSNC